MSEDILREISNEDLLLLKNLYESYKEKVPQVYGVINSCLAWKGDVANSACFNIFRLGGDDWLKTGTFVFIWEVSNSFIFRIFYFLKTQVLILGLSKNEE